MARRKLSIMLGMLMLLLASFALVVKAAVVERAAKDEYDTSDIENGGDKSYLMAFPNPGKLSGQYGITSDDLMLSPLKQEASTCSVVLHKLVYADVLARFCHSFGTPPDVDARTFIMTAVLATPQYSPKHACVSSEMLRGFINGLFLARGRGMSGM